MTEDLNIYYSSLAAPHKINCPCLRWDTSNWSVVITTDLNKDDWLKLVNNTRPGAVGEFDIITKGKRYYDSTWSGRNTLKIEPEPNPSYVSTLSGMRQPKIIYVKNLESRVLNPDWLEVKIEGYISGSKI